MTLTTRKIEAAKPKDKPYKLTDIEGLYLFVAPTGLKSWRANYKKDKKQRTRTYGRYPGMSLADARRAHLSARSGEPKSKTPTFAEVTDDWLRIKLPSLSNQKHKLQVQNTLERFVMPSIGKIPIDEIKRAQLSKIVQDIQKKGDRIETAHRVAGRITAVFNYAQDAGIIEAHSANGLVRVLQPRKTKKPMASIKPNEAGKLFYDIESYDDPVTRLGLKFLAMTFVRVGELRGMRWDELRENGAVWVIPETRMKVKLPHVVPLSTQAQAILKELELFTGDAELVLDSPAKPGRPISENTFLFALYRLGYRGRMTAHGFRALASTVLNENSFDTDVIERQLAHKEVDAVRAAYNRAQYLDQRRQMMQWYSDWIYQQHEDHRRSIG